MVVRINLGERTSITIYRNLYSILEEIIKRYNPNVLIQSLNGL